MAPMSQLDTTLSNSNSNLELLSQVGIGDQNELDACPGVRGAAYIVLRGCLATIRSNLP
jgi:hypothetical protein